MDLEEELKEIIHERDEVVKDDFDRLIDAASVLDLDQPMDLDRFLDLVTEDLSKDREEGKSELKTLFKRREEESTTAISPFVAIPHIVLDGDGFFRILIARCKGGVFFSKDSPEIKSVIVLMGTKDKRNLHLRSLAAVAHIIQSSHFEKEWMAARKPNNLKDIFLVGDRKRS